MQGRTDRQDLLGLILGLETAAARLEARLELDADVAGIWRLEAALMEAVRSVSLEEAPISVRDMLLRMTDNSLSGQDVQAVHAGLSALRLLRYPADPRAGMVGAIRRIESVFPAPRPIEGLSLWRHAETLDEATIQGALTPLMSKPGTPALKALRVAAEYAALTGHAAPLAERSLFNAVEGALRSQAPPVRRGLLSGDLDVAPADFIQIRASWILLPATALQIEGFRSWSPTTLAGMITLFERGIRSLDAEIGRYGEIRRWMESARAFARSGRGSAVRPRFVDFLLAHPVLTSALVMRRLDVSRRGAIDLIEAAETAGILRCLTPRRQMRYWATSGMADRLFQAERVPAHHARTLARQAAKGEGGSQLPGEARPGLSPEERRRARDSMEASFAELDDILRDTDRILADHRARFFPGQRGS